MKYINARDFVTRMNRKYGAKRFWVWEVLEAEHNIFKGTGALLTEDEEKDMERIIISGLAGEW